MNKRVPFYIILAILVSWLSYRNTFAQSAKEEEVQEKPTKMKPLERLQAGLYLGAYFANNYTAILYDGYGYDIDGQINDFTNSFLNRAIYNNSGTNGQQDNIANELGVQPGQWSFGESDMPVNLAYNIAFSVGLNTRVCINRRDAVILNVNAIRVNASGNFTITQTAQSSGTQTPGYINYRTFNITGSEERLTFQLGLQRLLGDIGRMNFFIEAGVISTLARYDKNVIIINSLTFDLATFYNQPGIIAYRPPFLTGIGLGGFGGLGVSMNAGRSTTVQLIYNPSYETIRIGPDPQLVLQHSIGLRVYGHL